MNVGYVDSATLTNAVGALVSHKKYHRLNYCDWNEWTTSSITDATVRLITYDKLEVAAQNP